MGMSPRVGPIVDNTSPNRPLGPRSTMGSNVQVWSADDPDGLSAWPTGEATFPPKTNTTFLVKCPIAPEQPICDAILLTSTLSPAAAIGMN